MSQTMEALVWTAPFESEVRAEPMPEPVEDERLLQVRAVGVCGSDLHGYRGHSPLRVPPLILGHEAVAGDGRRDYVVNPLVGCGDCRFCAAGEPNLCPRRGLLGLDRPGAFAEWIKVPAANLIELPEGMSPLVGTLVEPLATPMNALRGTSIDSSSVVAVVGAGPIGLLAAYAARAAGAGLVTCHDPDPRRAEHARALADVTGASPEDVRPAIDEASGGLGADLVIDAAGVEPSWTAALELARPGGTVAEIGLGQATGAVAVGDIVRRGLTLRGVYAYTDDDFRAALELLRDSPPPLDWAETRTLADGPGVLDELGRGEGPVKAIFALHPRS